jgi:hypothetical protein
MEDKEYEVEVVFRQRAVYRVRAADSVSAKDLGVEQWRAGQESDVVGYDWGEVEAVMAAETPDADRSKSDAELVLRFLMERERLILRLGGDEFGTAGSDAISAAQVAADLGWGHRAPAEVSPDVSRAGRALERLCESRRVICFERPRVRAEERGEIRLYCTPEHLNRLSASVNGLIGEAV